MKSAGESSERSNDPSRNAMIAAAISVGREKRGAVTEWMTDIVEVFDAPVIGSEGNSLWADEFVRTWNSGSLEEGRAPGTFEPFKDDKLAELNDFLRRNGKDP